MVVDTQFFGALPEFGKTTPSNSELTWLNYPIRKDVDGSFRLEDPDIIFSEWDEVLNALREGVPPDPSEIVAELEGKLHKKKQPLKILQT